MLCWREFNPVQWNWLLKITAGSQTTSLDSFTPSPPLGCCHIPLQWSPTPSWARQATLAAHSSPTVRTSSPPAQHKGCMSASSELDRSPPPNCPLALYPSAVGPGGQHLHSPPFRATGCMLPSPSLQLYRCCSQQNNPVPLCLIWFWFKSRDEISHLKRKGQIQILPSLNIPQSGSFTL